MAFPSPSARQRHRAALYEAYGCRGQGAQEDLAIVAADRPDARAGGLRDGEAIDPGRRADEKGVLLGHRIPGGEALAGVPVDGVGVGPCRPGSCSRTCSARGRTSRCRCRSRGDRRPRAPPRWRPAPVKPKPMKGMPRPPSLTMTLGQVASSRMPAARGEDLVAPPGVAADPERAAEVVEDDRRVGNARARAVSSSICGW